jgi:hypothetical protein
MSEQIANITVIVPRATVRKSLGVSDATLRNYQKLLSKLAPFGWDYRPKDRGFTVSSVEVLWSFWKMVRDGGMRLAILNIKDVMESKHGG